jgi:four helix bundle protein
MGGEIRSFRDLVAWQQAMELCKCVYSLSALFPDAERFGLTSQVRRAVVSVPSNIAEGYSRRSRHDYIRFLDIARSSLAEVQTQVMLAGELGMVSTEQSRPSLEKADSCSRVLFGLIRSLEDRGDAK